MKLRGHHLICLQFFSGKEYDLEFRELLSRLKRESDDFEVDLVDSADDICIKCMYLKDGKCNYQEGMEKEIREMDEKALTLLKIKSRRVRLGDVRARTPGIFRDWFAYCKTCGWKYDCMESVEWRKLAFH